MIGGLLLALGIAVGSRPLIIAEDTGTEVGAGYDCGTVFVPACDTPRYALGDALITAVLTVGGLACLSAALALLVTTRRGDPWLTGEALGFVAAPVFVFGLLAAAITYGLYVGTTFGGD